MRASLRLAVLAVLLGAVPLRAQADDLDQLLAKATWYSIDFINHLSSVVAEERYIQDSNVARQANEYLTRTGTDNITRPLLCEKWEASDAGRLNH